jgi:hypothetical protein
MPNGDPPPPGAQVELFQVQADGEVVACSNQPWVSWCGQGTTFRRDEPNPVAWYFFRGFLAVVTGLQPGEEGTFRLRAWVGTDWESASFRGESPDASVIAGGGTIIPGNLPLKSFVLWPRITLTLSISGIDAPDVRLASSLSSAGPSVVLQTSTDLANWEDLKTEPISGLTVSFDVFANENVRFYRLHRNP